MWLLLVLGAEILVLLVNWRRSGQGLVDYVGLGMVNSYARLWHRWSSNRPAPLPPVGPVLFAVNHTCSPDPSFVVAGCNRRVGFVIAAEYFCNFALRWFFDWIHSVPVTRNGRDVRAVREAIRVLKMGYVLCIFPEGGLTNAGRAGVRSAKAGVALIALRSRAPVYPVAIAGGPQTNAVAQAWLTPSAPKRVRVTYGDPIDLSRYYDQPITRALLEEVTRVIMGTVARLEQELRQKAAAGHEPPRLPPIPRTLVPNARAVRATRRQAV
jgi:1-acyl-sn-glycerol-3-phosphate acyltransferase